MLLVNDTFGCCDIVHSETHTYTTLDDGTSAIITLLNNNTKKRRQSVAMLYGTDRNATDVLSSTTHHQIVVRRSDVDMCEFHCGKRIAPHTQTRQL